MTLQDMRKTCDDNGVGVIRVLLGVLFCRQEINLTSLDLLFKGVCHCRPSISPLTRSTFSARGFRGRPGIRMMSPVKATMNPAPALI